MKAIYMENEVKNNYGLGLRFNENSKLDDYLSKFENRKIYEFQELTDRIGDIIVGWGEFASIQFYIILYQTITDEQLKQFLEILESESFLQQKQKVKLYIIYDNENKEKLKTILSICDGHHISNDFFSIYESNPESLSKKQSKLGLLPFHYDVDAISQDFQFTAKGLVPIELENTVEKYGFVAEKYWYWHEKSTILWQKVSDSDKYTLNKITQNLLKKNIEEISDIITKDNPHEIDFIDLGIGTPIKDEYVITSLMNKIKNYNDGKLLYFPIDISFPLMEYTLRVILNLKRKLTKEKGYEADFLITPILGDFVKLNEPDYQMLLGDKRTKLIALLGNTLGNFEEESLLSKLELILENCEGRGYVLIDVEFADRYSDPSKKEELKKQYANQDVYDFAFHPLDLLNKPKFSIEKQLTVKIDVIKEKKMDIRWNYGILGQTKRITDILNSYVVSLLYKYYDKEIRQHQEILILWSTRYMKRDFEDFITNKGFEICKKRNKENPDELEDGPWIDEGKRCGLYLLKYTPKKQEQEENA
jgi:hypothetical protein